MSEHSYIYFVQAGLSGPIKIGVTTDIKNRLSQLQTGNPENLRLLALHLGDRHLEKALHRYFAPHQVKSEWFMPNEELVELIENPSYLALWSEHAFAGN